MAKITNSSTLDHLGLVLGTQCGDSVWCFSKHAPLAPGEFLYAIPGLHEGVAVAEDRHGRSGTYLLGGVTWEAGEQLAHWLCSSGAESIGEPWSSVDSALELGAGVGLVSLTLGFLGVRTVLATDGDASLCEIASASAARNGVDGRVRAMRLRWGDSGDLEAALAVLGGKSASLVVAADVLYESTPAAADELEQTLRALIGRGGCRRVIFCWTVRNCTEVVSSSSTYYLLTYLLTTNCTEVVSSSRTYYWSASDPPVPLLWTGVPTPSTPVDRQAPLPIFGISS